MAFPDPPEPPAPPRPPPERIGPYCIEEHLGSGGMGEVYRAYDERLRRRVALKQIKPEAARKPLIRRRFLREARAAARLSHPTVVQVYDIVEADGCDWIVMELAEGRSLRSQIELGSLPVDAVVALAVELAAGLTVAHEQGIVHRDLKSDNVVLTAEGRPKILDFGLAKDLLIEESSVSRIGQLIGTPRSMSPEQATGQAVDHRSDLFSFGILLYEMLSGESPFYAPSALQSVTRVCSHDPPSLSEIGVQVPAALDALILRLLEKDRDDRPQETRQVLGELQQIGGELQRQGGGALASGYVPTFVPSANAGSGTIDAPIEEITLAALRADGTVRWVAATAVLTVLLAVATGAVWWREIGSASTVTSLKRGAAESGPATGPVSLVVLPFEQTGDAKVGQNFADEVAYEICRNLATVVGVEVVARWSDDAYRQDTRDPSELGRELGADYLLRAEIAREGDRVRVSPTLLRATDGRVVWSAAYDRDLDDRLGMQTRIGQEISRELEGLLLDRER